ncbi:hypothetical protein V5799_014622 [Amblyomma americanum]|uniref:Uncharacterized protein n=1 Tax=Amblyomma americanum TaxID=6943 RepID=A0AAQ4E2H3_AMBAM
MAAFKKTADPTDSSCFFTRCLKSRFYLVVLSARITLIEESEGHGPPERNLHETLGPKIDEDNLSYTGALAAALKAAHTRAPTAALTACHAQPSWEATVGR